MPEPVRFPPDLAAWTPLERSIGRCRYCGLPACTVDDSRTVCHVGCGVETAETAHQDELGA